MKELEYSNRPFHQTLDNLFSANRVGLREFARKSGVNYSYLSKLKNGKMPPPSNEVIRRIARGFRISADYFLEYRIRHVYELLLHDPDLVTALHHLCKQPRPNQKKIKKQFMKFVEKEASPN